MSFRFLELPKELILYISAYHVYLLDVLELERTCKLLHELIRGHIYDVKQVYGCKKSLFALKEDKKLNPDPKQVLVLYIETGISHGFEYLFSHFFPRLRVLYIVITGDANATPHSSLWDTLLMKCPSLQYFFVIDHFQYQSSSLSFAFKYDSFDKITNTILRYNTQFGSHNLCALVECVDFRFPVSPAKRLIKLGADVNAYSSHLDETPLMRACVYADENNWIKLYLNHGANPNTRDIFGRSPMRLSLSKSFLKNCKLLIDHGADINESFPGLKQSPLFFWMENDTQLNSEFLNFLLDNGAAVNVVDDEGKNVITCLLCNDHVSVEQRLTVLEILSKYKVNWNHKNHEKMSILDFAHKLGNTRLIEKLISFGACHG